MNHLLTLADAVAAHARLTPDKLAVRDSRRSLGYAQWHQRATGLANGLLGIGLAKGDRVALLAYNCAEWKEIYPALAAAGLVAVPINFRLTAAEIAYIILHSQARAVIAQDELTDRVDQVRADLALPDYACIAFGQTVPAGWRGCEALIDGASSDPPAVQVQPGDTSALMYTSGTTGKPKGAIRSHEGSTLMALATALVNRGRLGDAAAARRAARQAGLGGPRVGRLGPDPHPRPRRPGAARRRGRRALFAHALGLRRLLAEPRQDRRGLPRRLVLGR